MKRILSLMTVMALLTIAANAQLETKNGILILPEAGDWCLGFDAAPWLGFVGNLANGTDGNSSPSSQFAGNVPTMTLYGKYCIAANKFYRGRLRIGFNSGSDEYAVPDKVTFTDTEPFNETYKNDEVSTSSMNVNLGLGIEYRRGKGRIQGFYGPEVFVGFGTGKTTNTYANATDVDMTAGSASITSFSAIPNGIDFSGKRITEMKNGTSIMAGIRGFGGAEWFFMADAAIAIELGWGIGFTSTGAGETSTEYYEPALNNNAGGVRDETIASPGKTSDFTIDTDNAYGSVNLLFYF